MRNKVLSSALILIIVNLATYLDAAIVRAVFTSEEFVLRGEPTFPPRALTYPGTNVIVDIDESKTGPLENKEITFNVDGGRTIYDPIYGDWLVSFSTSAFAASPNLNNRFFNPTAYTSFSMTFGDRNQLTRVSMDIADGPPDFFLSLGGAAYVSSRINTFRAPGEWTVYPLPLPSGLPMLLGALMALATSSAFLRNSGQRRDGTLPLGQDS